MSPENKNNNLSSKNNYPNSWIFEALSENAEIIMGLSPPSKSYNKQKEGVPFLQGIRTFGNLYPTYDTWTTEPRKIAKKGSVLLSVRAPVAELNIANIDVCIGRGLAALSGKNNLFLYYLLKAFRQKIMSGENGTVFGAITKDVLTNIKLPFPPINEQEAISKILSDLDSKIELNQRMNKTLESIAQALFKHWFIDFEFPDENGNPYKSSGGEMVDSELGAIPKGWKVCKLKNIANFIKGFGYKGSEKDENRGNFVFVTLNSILEGGGFKRKFSYLTSNRVKEWNLVREGDIIIPNTEQTKSGRLIGFPAFVEFPIDYDKEFGVFSHHINKVVPLNENARHFVWHYLKTNQKNTMKYHTGTGVWGLDVNGWIEQEKVILPNDEILTEFNNISSTLFSRRLINNKSGDVLKGLRDILLPKLMSGKIRVPLEETDG